MGAAGLRASSGLAVLNTNYFLEMVSGIRGFDVPYGSVLRKHEVVVSAERLARDTGVGAGDVGKALIDMGLHPPTVYFPLIVKEALMFEFSDSETRENIDAYADALRRISDEAYSGGSELHLAPKNASVRRLDEVRASHPKTMKLSQRHMVG
jgi:glycine dehydrogenase subunit 2